MLTLYGLKVSYFTGKMEAYLRAKRIPFAFQSMTAEQFMTSFPAKLGALQMPVMELANGRLMTDTTPMIDWLEGEYPERPILPEDPAMAFFARLIEDYADEYLWRPAMHYRWSYWESAQLLRRQIVDEIGRDVPMPGFLKRWRTYRRQRDFFVRRDGVTAETWDHVEQAYLRLLEILDPIFARRDYLLGARVTLADIGLMGPLLRHFSMDPVPSKIMRETAPHVMAWVMRVWTSGDADWGDVPDEFPEDLHALVTEIGATHLVSLNANADAWAKNPKAGFYDMRLQGTDYKKVPLSHYRVWCLEQLQRHYHALEDEAKAKVDAVLAACNARDALLAQDGIKSGYNKDGAAPFGAGSLAVHHNVPK